MQRDEDWIWWEANRDLDASATTRYLGANGDKLQRVFRCPADTFDSRKAARGIAPGQGPVPLQLLHERRPGDEHHSRRVPHKA